MAKKIVEEQESSSSSEEEYDDNNGQYYEEKAEIDYSKLNSIDDLPSDDSCSIESSSPFPEEDDSDTNSVSSNEKTKMSIGEKLAYMSKKPKRKKPPSKPPPPEVETVTKKKSKHRPKEVSSSHKQYVKERKQNLKNLANNGISSDVIQSTQMYKPRDPRMDSLCGHYDVNVFEKRFAFLEEMEDQELDNLKDRIKAKKLSKRKGKDVALQELGLTEHELTGTLEEDQAQLSKLSNRKGHRQKERKTRSTKQDMKQSIQKAVESGKQAPFYLKRKDIQKKILEDEYEHISKTKSIDKVMEKKRRKIASKE